MNIKQFVSFVFFLSLGICIAQQETFKVTASIDISEDLKSQFKDTGRLYLFLSTNPNGEPRWQTWPSPSNKNYIFAKNMEGLKANKAISVKDEEGWMRSGSWSLTEVPKGEYNVQVLWDQDFKESRIDAPGNLFSEVKKINIKSDTEISFVINQFIAKRRVTTHELSREVNFKSDLLSDFWNKPVYLKASVLLPKNYDNSKAYPIRYNVAGYGGRYTRINRLLNSDDFMNWWQSEEAPEIITVFLDGEGPFGDSYQMDSDNSGPYGASLITELITHIESQYRGTDSPTTRFVDGCSTGGWVSLGLQLYYPDTFNGVFSYSPDAIEFENYQLINIYKDENAFENEFGYARPVMRSTLGEPMLSLKEFIQYENVLGYSNSYIDSGGQFSAHNALYSPKGTDGNPAKLFDPVTGDIDPAVAEHWKKYDFKIYAKENWAELGPKIQGKIYVWMGDMDHFYLNMATRSFADFLETTENPKSDADIEFSAMEGHCTQYSNKKVLLQIQERINLINAE
ncbi:MAG: alpha/beta hydrolase-fold protein [Bacteroidota bacterium]